VHWIFTGTHTGLFADVIATGKKVRINGFSHFYFNKDGQIYQEDIFYNELEFLQQLGYSLEAPRLK
jgi:predicted ester cyclase